MGASVGAKLCFGYNLGGGESSKGWNIKEDLSDPYEAPDAPWWDDLDRPEWFDEEPPSDVPSYAEAAKLVLKETGVTPIFSYQYRGEFYSDLVLVTYSMESWEGETVSVDMVELERRRVEEKWDAKLANAAKMLGVTPTHKPMWHVLPSYF